MFNSTRQLIIWTAVLLLVVLEVGWFAWPRRGSPGRDAYRFNERSEAFFAYSTNQSTSNWNEVEKELKLVEQHESREHLAILLVLLASNIPIVLLTLKCGKHKIQT